MCVGGWIDRWDLTRAIFEKGLCLEPLPNFETKGECDGDEDDWLRSIRFLYIASRSRCENPKSLLTINSKHRNLTARL